ncbi:MAG: hypothetical protein QW343_01815 [Candidatus Norongarragalinales archaeon]
MKVDGKAGAYDIDYFAQEASFFSANEFLIPAVAFLAAVYFLATINVVIFLLFVVILLFAFNSWNNRRAREKQRDSFTPAFMP